MGILRLRSNHLLSAVGKCLILSGLILGALPALRAEKVVVTITGTATAGDMYGIFGLGKAFTDQPFTLVVTFDDANAQINQGGDYPGTSSLLVETGASSAATAVLTIGNGSFTFGEQANSRLEAARYLQIYGRESSISLSISEGQDPQIQGFSVMLQPVEGNPLMTKSLDWHSPLAQTEYDPQPRLGTFAISKPHDFIKLTKGYLIVKTVSIE
jgi:hypothetical protein